MPALNKVYLMGNLTRTPELRHTPGGAAICEFGLAVNRRFISNGIPKDETIFVEINVWQKQGEICHRRLQKGSLVMIEGRLKTDQWEDRETGKKKSRVLVVAEKVHFLAMPPREEYREDHDNGQNESNEKQQPRTSSKFQGERNYPNKNTSPPASSPPPPPIPEQETNGKHEEIDDIANNTDDDNVPF
jgi:single-strand DNA-binding protein